MSVREAGPDDVDRIAQLHAVSWQHTYRGIYRDEFLDGDILQNRLALWSHRLSSPSPNQYVLVAEDDSKILGFACVYGDRDSQWGSMLDNLHVQPDSKSRGVGTQLIGRAARWSRENYPQCKYFLWVFEKNQPARRYYARLGGIHSESVEVEVPGGSRAIECRYTWSNVNELIEAADRSSRRNRQ
jgi:GNAT superfamily N-acetyltransferase